jgi:PGF-pre-PGF domain-containing protein
VKQLLFNVTSSGSIGNATVDGVAFGQLVNVTFTNGIGDISLSFPNVGNYTLNTSAPNDGINFSIGNSYFEVNSYPNITDVGIDYQNNSTANVSWTTDQNTTSQVYIDGVLNVNDSSLVINHSEQVQGLNFYWIYNYSVLSCNDLGICSNTSNVTFGMSELYNESVNSTSSTTTTTLSGGSSGGTGGGGSGGFVSGSTQIETSTSVEQTTTTQPIPTVQVSGQNTSNGATGVVSTSTVAAQQPVQVSFPQNPAGVNVVTLTPSNSYSGQSFVVSATSLGTSLPPQVQAAPPAKQVIAYLNVSDGGTPVSNATIYFSVPLNQWSDGVSPLDIVLYHYSGGNWTALPTTYISGDNFSAVTPSFSVFAIGIAASSPATVQAPSSNSNQPASNSGANPQKAASTPSSPGSLITDLGIIIAGAILLGGGYYWYSKRNQPL